MTNGEEFSAIRRVLVAGRSGSVADETVKAAQAIAAAFQAELAALFVEDSNLVRMAALPFTREIGAASGSVRPIEPADMERALRLQADRMRRSLDQFASFRVERGGFAQRILDEITDSVAVVLSPASRHLHRTQAQPQSRSVMAVYDDSSGGARALALGLRLSQSQAVLRVAVAAATDLEFLARQDAARLRASTAGDRFEFVRLAGSHPLDLAGAVRHRTCAALLLSSQSMNITPERLTLLIENLYCPLVLLR
jgi:hypothetical protein